jgi:N-acetylmuramoyl-L-alanine amidase
MRKLNEIIVHCSATPEGKNFTVEQIRRWHKARGWSDIGYHYVIYLDGSVHEGRSIRLKGAHVAGRNTGTIGVCYIGGVKRDGKTPKDTRTAAQKKSLELLLKRLLSEYPSINKISGHNQYANKACPCFNADAEYSSLTGKAPEKLKSAGVDGRLRYLQKLLKKAGFYAGQLDGLLGPQTTDGIINYQKANNLDLTGKFDTATVKHLRKVEVISPAAKQAAVVAVVVTTTSAVTLWDKVEAFFAGWF